MAFKVEGSGMMGTSRAKREIAIRSGVGAAIVLALLTFTAGLVNLG